MNHAPEILTGLSLFVVGWLAIERWLHWRALTQIPIRVHVNGTRGKSSVTRLIASGMRAGKRRVIAKTTGTLARVVLDADRELAIYRPLGANVREQIRVVRFAAELDAEVLVVECMALQPILQWLTEKVFIRATHGVITNARPDHLDVMGPTGDDVAKALSGMMPRKGICFTAERERLAILQYAADDRKSRLVAITEEDVAAIEPADLEGFAHYEHADNVALALAVCTELGVEREVALAGMWAGQPDPGALTFDELDFFGRRIVFVNALAANDPVSSQRIWELCVERYPSYRTLALFNCRADRADRSRQLGESLVEWTAPDRVLAVGSGTVFFGRAASRAGFDASRIVVAEDETARMVFERIVEQCGQKTLVVGLGNIGGLGLDLVRLFRNRAEPGLERRPRPEVTT